MILNSQEKINIFKNLFRGREDIFAVHWEKQGKSASGYTPVCLNEWKQGLCNKLLRKKCKECDHKQYAQLDDYRVEQHLRGNKIYGIYPLLENNSSYFLVYPFAFHGKLTQYVGRIQRGGQNGKKIYDYRDRKVEYLERLFKKRLKYYQKNFGSK